MVHITNQMIRWTILLHLENKIYSLNCIKYNVLSATALKKAAHMTEQETCRLPLPPLNQNITPVRHLGGMLR